MIEALDKWIDWPNEIEGDLYLQGVDIGLWHTLAINPATGAPHLSSRRLLVLLDKLEAERTGEYAKAVEGRKGMWSEPEQIAAETYNAVSNLVHTTQALHSDPERFTDYDPPRFIDPSEREALAAEQNVDELEDLDM